MKNKIAGITDCIESLAVLRGITRKEAETIMKDVLKVISDKCIEGGVSFKDLFTLRKVTLKGKKGVCSFNGIPWETKDKYRLKLTTGKDLSEKLNK